MNVRGTFYTFSRVSDTLDSHNGDLVDDTDFISCLLFSTVYLQPVTTVSWRHLRDKLLVFEPFLGACFWAHVGSLWGRVGL
jgi:hypothetical protein